MSTSAGTIKALRKIINKPREDDVSEVKEEEDDVSEVKEVCVALVSAFMPSFTLLANFKAEDDADDGDSDVTSDYDDYDDCEAREHLEAFLETTGQSQKKRKRTCRDEEDLSSADFPVRADDVVFGEDRYIPLPSIRPWA